MSDELSVSDAIQSRHSIRSFAPDEVEEDKLLKILNAGLWVSSGGNAQPWRFIVAQSSEARQALLGGLTPGNAEWASTAPMFLVVCARPEDSRFHNRDGKQYYLYECGLAVQNMILQATGLGVKARQMGGWSEPDVQNALGIPPEYRVVIVVALGYEGPMENLSEEHRARQLLPRTRREMTDSVFWDRFGSNQPS